MNNLHLVPQVILDVGEKFKEATSDHIRVNYQMRLEAIREYCDEVMSKPKPTPSKVSSGKTKARNGASKIAK